MTQGCSPLEAVCVLSSMPCKTRTNIRSYFSDSNVHTLILGPEYLRNNQFQPLLELLDVYIHMDLECAKTICAVIFIEFVNRSIEMIHSDCTMD